MTRELDVLAPSCVFCGYSGEGYWQAGTHDEKCPWFGIGGADERLKILRDALQLKVVPDAVSYANWYRDALSVMKEGGYCQDRRLVTFDALEGVKTGLGNKYVVAKVEGEVDPKAQYFVLRIDTDVHARKALWLYAKSVRKDNEALANDLIDWLMETLNTPAGREDLIRIMDEMVEK